MKFWKLSLLTVVLFACVATLIVHTSCERNICDNVTCFNGGSCNSGVCHCPIGYEDPQCQTKSVSRYVGMYVGTTQFNGGPQQIDTAWITADPSKINYVYVNTHLISPKVLHGYVSNNEATYSIIVPNDSVAFDLKQYSLNLQGDKTLTIHLYEWQDSIPGDTVITKSDFFGSKQ